MKWIKEYVLLHFLLLLYSFSTVLSKLAGRQGFLTKKFVIIYGLIIFILGVYAIGWQQIIKKIPLTEAYANKAVTVVWGIIWGGIFFSERITTGKLVGAILVIVGIVLFSMGGEQK